MRRVSLSHGLFLLRRVFPLLFPFHCWAVVPASPPFPVSLLGFSSRPWASSIPVSLWVGSSLFFPFHCWRAVPLFPGLKPECHGNPPQRGPVHKDTHNSHHPFHCWTSPHLSPPVSLLGHTLGPEPGVPTILNILEIPATYESTPRVIPSLSETPILAVVGIPGE